MKNQYTILMNIQNKLLSKEPYIQKQYALESRLQISSHTQAIFYTLPTESVPCAGAIKRKPNN